MTTKIPVELSSTPGIVDGSNATAITIDSSERVGIGTTSPSQKLETTGNIFINAPSGNPDLTIKTAGVGNNPFVAYRAGDNLVFDNMAVFSASTDYWRVAYGSSGSVTTELLAVTSAGNVGIGTVTPSQKLHVVGKIKCTDDLIIGGTSPRIDYDGGSTGSLRFFSTSTGTERMRIESGGNVGIGTTSPATNLHIDGANDNTNGQLRISSPSNGDAQIVFFTTLNGRGMYVDDSDSNKFKIYGGGGKGVNEFVIDNTGNVTIAGSLSKGSGSFKIDHPLEAKKDTHHLVHSFVEAPQADLIYRGKIDLVDGSATVNIDTVAGMTEGTFVALNTDVQCFTTNESDWDAVKGSVSGNILTISCQNTSSTATVSWLVIGERHDQHMIDTEWTDDNGKVIVEPIKEGE